MLKIVSLALAGFALSVSAGVAQTALTSQEKAACRPDAIKLCASSAGNPAKMSQCLVENKASLSEACLKVVEAHGG